MQETGKRQLMRNSLATGRQRATQLDLRILSDLLARAIMCAGLDLPSLMCTSLAAQMLEQGPHTL